MTEPNIETILDTLRGPREHFREILENKDELLRGMCDYAEFVAKRKKVPAWSVIGEITSHGSGVSCAIYELYRRRENGLL